MATREPIYVALANLVFSYPEVQSYFVTTGRRLRHHAQLPAGAVSCPAMYLVQHPGERHTRKGTLLVRELLCHFVMYFYNSAPDAVVSTALNAGLDAIDDAVNTKALPIFRQTLGDLVENVWTDGVVQVDEGLLQEFSLVAVPVTILMP